MPATLKVLVPEATSNYILNPAIRYDTTGWNALSSVISRVLDHARFGIASLKVVTTGAALREGAYFRVTNLAGISDPITVSAYVRGDAGNERVHIRLIDNPTGHEWVSKPVALSADRWTRLEVTGVCTGSNDMRLYVETDDVIREVTFYVDGAQMERKYYSTSYCDGDQPGCQWNLMDSNSISTRDAYTRKGGKWITIFEPCKKPDDIYATVFSGFGMAPIQNNIQTWAMAPGSYYDNTKVQDRVITITFNVKHTEIISIGKPDISPLHKLRQQLIDIFKPDAAPGGEPFLLSYQEGEREIFVWARYEAGLEGQWDIRNRWYNSFILRMLAVDPILYTDDQDAAALSYTVNEILNYVATYKDGLWQDMNFGVNGAVRCFGVGRRGEIYIGGDFTIVNNNANAVDPFLATNRIAYWNGTQWQGMGGANGTVYAIKVAPNGNVYAAGDFTVIGGVACNRIAYWDGAAWNPLTDSRSGINGTNGIVYDLVIGPNGYVYIVGAFTLAGNWNCYRIAYYDGADWWGTIALNGLNNTAYSIVMTQDGKTLYVGGIFTQNQAGVVTLDGVIQIDIATLANATDLDFGSCYDLCLSPAGKLYAAGTANDKSIKYWNGSAWNYLGGSTLYDSLNMGVGFVGVGPVLGPIIAFEDESLLIAGGHLFSGNRAIQYLTYWNGSAWAAPDIEVTAAPTALFNGRGNIYLGTGTTADHGVQTTIENSGTMETQPILYIYGQGLIRWIENQTTRQRIYLFLQALSGEELFIDLKKKEIRSTVRGVLYAELILGSDFGDFVLAPGNNRFSVFITDDVSALCYIYSTPVHWSADASPTPEAMA